MREKERLERRMERLAVLMTMMIDTHNESMRLQSVLQQAGGNRDFDEIALANGVLARKVLRKIR